MYSFITSGNFIIFRYTESVTFPITALNSVFYEHDVFKLHNTSKCIDWNLPEDTTKITFTIDETRYENILLSDIDFDGSTCGVQQDFIDGLQAIFENLAGGGSSSSSYLVWDAAYQNSAMTSPVGIYLYKDTDGNIWKTYEPVKGNTVQRSQFDYADTIDKFAFDLDNNFNAKLSDVKLIGIDAALVIFRNTELSDMVLNGTGAGVSPITFDTIDTGTKTFVLNASFGDMRKFFTSDSVNTSKPIPIIVNGSTSNDGIYTISATSFDGSQTSIVVNEAITSSIADGGITGLTFLNYIQKGTLGIDNLNTYPNGAEIYVVGDNVRFINSSATTNSYFDSMGNNCVIKNSIFSSVDIDFLESENCIIAESHFCEWAGCEFNENGGSIRLCHLDDDAYIDAYDQPIEASQIMANSYLNAVTLCNSIKMGVGCNIDSTGGSISGCSFGDFTTVTTAGVITNKTYQAIDGTTYLLSVTAGAVTATAV